MPNPSVKDEGLYREPARRSSRSGSYDSWTVYELKKRAKELGMTGYSSLSKEDLITELRQL